MSSRINQGALSPSARQSRAACLLAGLALAMTGAVLGMGPFALSTPAQAQQPPPKAPAKTPGKSSPTKTAKKPAGRQEAGKAEGDGKPDPASAQRSLETGIKAFETGKTDQAVQSLTHALSGGLAPQPMAKALYYRGMAHRKQGKPAQAISDLTSAIWLKGGLGDQERAAAIGHRSAAYKEAGLADPGTDGLPSASGGGVAVASNAKSSSWTGGAGDVPAPIPGTATAQPAASSSGSSGGIGGFFSNLFGGGSSQPQAPSAAPSTPAAPVAAANPRIAMAMPASAWSDQTSVSTGGVSTGALPASAAAKQAAAPQVPPGPRVAAAAAPATVAAAKPAPAKAVADGKYRIVVAAVRSRAEADAVVVKLKQMNAPAIAARGEPLIDETQLGGFGNFFRVRVGPFADAKEPNALCPQLRSGGLDCHIVTN